ncbi:hypothetical protein SC1_00771 [Sphingopyxis sp. C-1]|nr:hypothetical protein SC1_00771 [Sphingopyxis sp. C-1]
MSDIAEFEDCFFRRLPAKLPGKAHIVLHVGRDPMAVVAGCLQLSFKVRFVGWPTTLQNRFGIFGRDPRHTHDRGLTFSEGAVHRHRSILSEAIASDAIIGSALGQRPPMTSAA